MRSRFLRSALVTACAFAFAVLLVPLALHAQDSTPAASTSLTAEPPPALVVTAENFAEPWIVGFAKTHTWLATILAVMGAIGAVAKPIMTGIETYVRNSPSKEDDAMLERVEHSTWFRWFAWFLDYFTRIKIGPQFTAKPAATQEPQG